MNHKLEEITPERARTLLSSNDGNRNIKESAVARYRNDIVNNKWKHSTGEFIKISQSGKLIDGQHRLTAVVQAQKSVYMDVMYDIPDENFTFIDTGVSRSSSDVMRISGIQNSALIAGIIATEERLKALFTGNRIVSLNMDKSSKFHYKMSNNDIMETYNKNPKYWDNISMMVQRLYKESTRLLAPSAIGGLLSIIGNEYDIHTSQDFLRRLLVLEGNCPSYIRLLNKKLRDDQINNRGKMKANFKLALIIKAFNTFISNKDVKEIRILDLSVLPKLLSNQN